MPTQMFSGLPARATFVADTNFVSGTHKKIIIIIKVLKKRILHIKCLDAFYNLKKELSRNRYVFIALLKLPTLSLCLMASGS